MRTPVAILGATGLVGQVFVERLATHALFRPAELIASPELAGRAYGDVVAWQRPTPLPAEVAGLELIAAPEELASKLAFSALDASVAAELEGRYADAGAFVFSNAASHRMDPDVPLVVPEVNAEHLALAAAQARPGAIVTNPNCSTIGLTLVLAPLARAFGLRRASVVSLQARSGAGLKNGRLMELENNVIPFIGGEEEKLATETQKIMGTLRESGSTLSIEPATLEVSATCTRVPVDHGHTLCLSVELERAASHGEVHAALASFRARPQELSLQSAPARPLRVFDAPDFPQPALHADLEGGMASAVARLRPDALFGEARDVSPRRGWKLVTLSHNLVRGAAGGSILNAELAIATGTLVL